MARFSFLIIQAGVTLTLTLALAFGLILAPTRVRAASDPLDNWTARPTGLTNSLQNMVQGNGLLVAVGYQGTIATSPDGQEWTRRDSGTILSLYTVTYGGGLFVAAGDRGALTVSEDGTNWVAINSGTFNPLFGSTYGDGRWVVAGGSNVLVSVNGFQWNNRSSPLLPKAFLNAIAYGAGRYVAVGAGLYSVWSTNTVDWHRGETDLGNYFALTYAAGRFVGVGGGFNTFTEFGTSTDGSSWQARSFESVLSLIDVTYGNGRFLAPGLILTFPPPDGLELLFESEDGLNWTTRTLPTPSAALGLTYANGRFYAVGHFGLVLESDSHVPARLALAGPPGTNGLELRIRGEVGRQYRVQTSAEADGTNWQDLLIFTNPNHPETRVIDPEAGVFPRRFYRAISP